MNASKINYLTSNGRPVPELRLGRITGPGDNDVEQFTSPRFEVTLVGITISSVEPEYEGHFRLIASYEIHHNSEDFIINVISKFAVAWILFSHTHTLVCSYIMITMYSHYHRTSLHATSHISVISLFFDIWPVNSCMNYTVRCSAFP